MKSLLLILLLLAAPKAHALWRNTPTPRLHSIFDDGDTLRKRHQWFTPERSEVYVAPPPAPPRVLTDRILHRRGVRMLWWGIPPIVLSVPLLMVADGINADIGRAGSPMGSSYTDKPDPTWYYVSSAVSFALGVFLIARGSRLVKKYPRHKRIEVQ